jgi:hypothetical protein
VISLEDERVDVFSIVNQFVYTRQLSDKVDHNLDWDVLVRAWLFGDKYLIHSLQNRVMSVLIEKNKVTNIIPTLSVKLIYANTLPDSPLRKLMVDWTAYLCDVSRLMCPEGGLRCHMKHLLIWSRL